MDSKTYTQLLNNNILTVETFWINLLGLLSLYDKKPKNIFLYNYFRDNVNPILSNIDPTRYSDLYVSIQLLADKGYFRFDIATSLFKLLEKIRVKKITKINETALRKLLLQIHIEQIRFTPVFEQIIYQWLHKKNKFEDLPSLLFAQLQHYKICREFYNIVKYLQR